MHSLDAAARHWWLTWGPSPAVAVASGAALGAWVKCSHRRQSGTRSRRPDRMRRAQRRQGGYWP